MAFRRFFADSFGKKVAKLLRALQCAEGSELRPEPARFHNLAKTLMKRIQKLTFPSRKRSRLRCVHIRPRKHVQHVKRVGVAETFRLGPDHREIIDVTALRQVA